MEELEDTQRSNQNSQIEEGQTTQWSKEKGQKVHNHLQNYRHVMFNGKKNNMY